MFSTCVKLGSFASALSHSLLIATYSAQQLSFLPGSHLESSIPWELFAYLLNSSHEKSKRWIQSNDCIPQLYWVGRLEGTLYNAFFINI